MKILITLLLGSLLSHGCKAGIFASISSETTNNNGRSNTDETPVDRQEAEFEVEAESEVEAEAEVGIGNINVKTH